MNGFNPLSRDLKEFEVEPKFITRTIDKLKVAFLSTPTKIRGVDLSHWNGVTDFAQIKASGIDFSILKASEDVSWVDSQFAANWIKSTSANMPTMIYHFFRSNYSGRDQALHCLDVASICLSDIDKKTIIFADVETPDGTGNATRIARVKDFLDAITAAGVKTGIYSSASKWLSLMTPYPSWVNDYVLWVASYTSFSAPIMPTTWSAEVTKFWQYGIYPTYSWVEPIYGAGTVDANWFFGTINELWSLLGVEDMTCCEELAEQIALLQAQLTSQKATIDNHSSRLNAQAARITALETEIPLMNDRLSTLERITQAIKDLFT